MKPGSRIDWRRPGPATLTALAVTALAAIAFAAGPTRADAAVYWGDGGTIGIANLDGSSASAALQPTLSARNTCGLAVDASYVYWVDASAGTIGRANLDGSSPDEAFISGLRFPCGVAVDASHVYWADRITNTIGRANLDGRGVERAFIAGGNRPCGVAVDGSHIYWGNHEGNAIGRSNLDGTDSEQAYIAEAKSPCGVAVTATHVYWGSSSYERSPAGAIGRASVDGGSVENSFIPEVGEPWSVAVNSTHIYWTDEGGRNFLGGGDPQTVLPGSVGRARLDGTEVNRRLIPTGLALGVALDGRTLPGPPPRPSDYFHFGKLTRDRRTRAIQLILRVPAGGELTVDAPMIGWRVDKGDPTPPAGGPLLWKLTLWPGKGRAASKIRHRLKRNGRASFVLQVTYQQEGRLPLEASKRLAFLRPQAHR